MPHQARYRGASALPCLLLAAAAVSTAFAAPFKPDADTLLLAHFEGRPDRADYANGWDAFGGGGYSSAEGYYGKGVDLRGVRLADDFWKVENAFLPHYTQWIFWPRGNVSFRQGTLEFWFKPAAAEEKRSVSGNDLLHFMFYQPLRPQPAEGYEPAGLSPDEELARAGTMKAVRHVQPFINLTQRSLRWMFVTLKGKEIKGRVDFPAVPHWGRKLDPQQWMHFALQWSPEGVAIYLDGRLVGSHPMEENSGLALTGPTQRGVALNGIVLDELRISAKPRYRDAFEPAWREGARPGNAFPGVASATPVPWREHPADLPLAAARAKSGKARQEPLGAWTAEFDEKSGRLTGLRHGSLAVSSGKSAAGLLVWKGTGREPLPEPETRGTWARGSDGVAFEQAWADSLFVRNRLAPGRNGEIRWVMEFENRGGETLWLETLLALPVMPTATEFFDMSWTQEKLPFPRRRDEFIFSLPMTAASDGKAGLGAGLDPHQGVSALIGEWLPGSGGNAPVIRQGTRVVLAPGETQRLEFVVFASSGAFGVRDTLAAYHSLFPDLYRQSPAVPVYSYLGVCQYFSYVNVPDLTRLYYSGGQWGHGPYHTKGDYLGDPRFWGRKDLQGRSDYAHAAGNEQRYKTIANLRDEVVKRSRDSFYNYYTPRRSHDVPNLAARFLIEELMPGIEFPDDPLSAGQYFAPRNYVVNEFNTPLGFKFMDDQAETMRLIGRYSPGFINDFCQSSNFRFTDPYARRSPGRAFSEDRGEYAVASLGHWQRYQMINGFSDQGRQQSMISDWGMISYLLSAYSAANTFESGDPFVSTTGMKIGLQVSRNLLGEKPISVLTSYGHDDMGKEFAPGDFTPERLRDYYRFAFRRSMLTALETGYYADPPLLHGKQWNSEVNPILVESLVYGRKTVPGVKGGDGFWIARAGEGERAILIAGNFSTAEAKGALRLLKGYFGGTQLWAPYFGGELAQRVTPEATEFPSIAAGAHDIAAFKPVAELSDGAAEAVTARWEGDGLTIQVNLKVESAGGCRLRLLSPAEYYRPGSIRLNGREPARAADGSFLLPPGTSEISAVLSNTVLKLDAAAWAKVDLIRDGKPNFRILGSSQPGYERGTASQLNWFLQQYDEEDGIAGNLEDAPIDDSEASIPAGFAGWVIDVRPDPNAGFGQSEVTLDPAARRIHLIGLTPGHVRRAMMLFMRLVDRKYPHIGRHVPLDRNLKNGWKTPGWNEPYNPETAAWKRLYKRRTETLQFFEQFSDRDFLTKPILEKPYEPLYAGGNADFQGKYALRHSPYLFEPTFTEEYVYGYSGPRFEEPPPKP